MKNSTVRDGIILCCAACLMVALAMKLSPAARAAVSPTTAAAQQASEVSKLLNDLHKPATTPEQKRQIIDRLLDMGEEGPRRLATQSQRDFQSRYASYLDELEQRSADALRASWKGKGDMEQQVEEARKIVIETSKAPNLTEEMIHHKSDPAMAKLDSLFTITRAAVQSAEPELKQDRAALLDLAATWGKAVGKLSDDRRKSLGTTASAPDSRALDKDLAAKEELAAMMATPMLDPDRQILLANMPLAEKLDPAEAKGTLILNLIRIRLGIGALAIDPKLGDAARGHSTDMREKGFFAHESPVPGKETPWKRAKLAGTTADAENIYEGSAKAEDAIQGWWESPGHHKNMLDNHRRTGLGRSEKFFTQLFG